MSGFDPDADEWLLAVRIAQERDAYQEIASASAQQPRRKPKNIVAANARAAAARAAGGGGRGSGSARGGQGGRGRGTRSGDGECLLAVRASPS